MDSSKYKVIKVEAEMQGTIEKLITILKDVSNNKNWVYNTKRSYLVKAISERRIFILRRNVFTLAF